MGAERDFRRPHRAAVARIPLVRRTYACFGELPSRQAKVQATKCLFWSTLATSGTIDAECPECSMPIFQKGKKTEADPLVEANIKRLERNVRERQRGIRKL